jgi:hypothetical protein
MEINTVSRIKDLEYLKRDIHIAHCTPASRHCTMATQKCNVAGTSMNTHRTAREADGGAFFAKAWKR